jgi:hypothetical protein
LFKKLALAFAMLMCTFQVFAQQLPETVETQKARLEGRTIIQEEFRFEKIFMQSPTTYIILRDIGGGVLQPQYLYAGGSFKNVRIVYTEGPQVVHVATYSTFASTFVTMFDIFVHKPGMVGAPRCRQNGKTTQCGVTEPLN